MLGCRKGDIMAREGWLYGVDLIYAQGCLFQIAQAFGKAEKRVTQLVGEPQWRLVV